MKLDWLDLAIIVIIPLTRILDALLTFIGINFGASELNSCLAGIVGDLPISLSIQLAAGGMIVLLLFYLKSLRFSQSHPRLWAIYSGVVMILLASPVILNLGALMGYNVVPSSIVILWSVCK